jgi:hypothetical protein
MGADRDGTRGSRNYERGEKSRGRSGPARGRNSQATGRSGNPTVARRARCLAKDTAQVSLRTPVAPPFSTKRLNDDSKVATAAETISGVGLPRNRTDALPFHAPCRGPGVRPRSRAAADQADGVVRGEPKIRSATRRTLLRRSKLERDRKVLKLQKLFREMAWRERTLRWLSHSVLSRRKRRGLLRFNGRCRESGSFSSPDSVRRVACESGGVAWQSIRP